MLHVSEMRMNAMENSCKVMTNKCPLDLDI